MTKGTHRQNVKALAKNFLPMVVEATDQIIDQYVEYGCRRSRLTILAAHEHTIRTSVTKNHGDKIPDDWLVYANRAYYTSGGAKYPLKFCPIERLGSKKFTSYDAATLGAPAIYFENQRIYGLPNATMTNPNTSAPYADLTSIEVYYYPRGPKLFGPTIADSTDDALPSVMSQYADQYALRLVIEHFQSAEIRIKMAEERRQQLVQDKQAFFAALYGSQNRNVEDMT